LKINKEEKTVFVPSYAIHVT